MGDVMVAFVDSDLQETVPQEKHLWRGVLGGHSCCELDYKLSPWQLFNC
jgi:hypothetical protein